MIAASILALLLAAGPAPSGPAVSAIDAAGLKAAIESERGKVVILNFWATWCDPCREEFPDLVRLASENPGRVVLIAVSLDDPDEVESKVKPFLCSVGFSGRGLVKAPGDPDPFITSVDPKWSGALPATFIHDRDGRRAHAFLGAVTYKSLKETLAPLLSPAR